MEDTFWTLLKHNGLDITKLFLIKSIGDEVWYSYDLNGLEELQKLRTTAKIIDLLVSLHTKCFSFSAGPPEGPDDWDSSTPGSFVQIDLPLKITLDVTYDAFEVGELRERFLASPVASLIDKETAGDPVRAGDDEYINLCNRLGLATRVKTDSRLFSTVRSDYIGWEVDRFFRLTKFAARNAVLLGPSVISGHDADALFSYSNSFPITKNEKWKLHQVSLKIPVDCNSYTTLGSRLKLATRTLQPSDQKGIGEKTEIGIIHGEHQEDVELPK
ncbi:MAG: hypothetical protein U5L08_15735 [Xanthomonadales bacterium]|nr:hypothetical protein [Xanthomonadales bacterium]